MQEILMPVLALGGMGAFFGALLGVAAKAFRVETDLRSEKIAELLPGANCGGCGFAGCAAMAEALLQGTASLSACASLREEPANKIAEILGVEPPSLLPMTARVLCGGSCNLAEKASEYTGILDCNAAVRYGGEKACVFGCLGFGSCVGACSFGALTVKDGVARVDAGTCTGCGACVKACPQKLIELVPRDKRLYVACRSHDKGRDMKDICKAGCIGCGICAKNCPAGAVTVTDNLASVLYETCTNCGVCAEKCPKQVIQFLE